MLAAVELVESFNLSPSARARTDKPVVREYQDDDVLEIEVEGGFTYWTSAKAYSEEVPLLKPDVKDGDVVTFDTLPRGSERGVKDWVQSGLRVLRLQKDSIADTLGDPSQWPTDLPDLIAVAKDLALDLTALPAWFLTKATIRIIEGRLDPAPGLYRWAEATRKLSDDADGRKLASVDDFDVDKPILVFIHGTASSTRGSFGAFLSEEYAASVAGAAAALRRSDLRLRAPHDE